MPDHHPLRIAVIVALAALLSAGVVLTTRWLSDGGAPEASRGSPAPQQSGVASAATQLPTSSQQDAAGRAEQAERAALRVLAACQDKVVAGDRALDAAAVGAEHWMAHVQAQTDANEGRVSVAEMRAIWKKTRLAGPVDVGRYSERRESYRSAEGICKSMPGAAAEVAEHVRDCAARAEAMRPMMRAADAVMDDWADHLADMRMSAAGHAADPQGRWLATWRKAPKNIDAYTSAQKRYADAPTCDSGS